MAQEITRMRLGPNARLALGLVLGFAAGVPAGMFAPRLWRGGDKGVIAGGLPAQAVDRSANPPGPELQLFEQTGTFSGRQGEVYFPYPYALPPNVELKNSSNMAVVETTAGGFKWRDTSFPPQGYGGTWVAKGIKATKVP